MIQRTPTLNEIRRTLFAATQGALADEIKAGKVFFVPPAQDVDPALPKILVISSFSPGDVDRMELGGYGALALRHGIWKTNISTLKDINANEPWQIAEKLEEAFRIYTVDGLQVVNPDDDIYAPCAIYCEFPYSENIGALPDGRNGITVTVPWWTWTQN